MLWSEETEYTKLKQIIREKNLSKREKLRIIYKYISPDERSLIIFNFIFKIIDAQYDGHIIILKKCNVVTCFGVKECQNLKLVS